MDLWKRGTWKCWDFKEIGHNIHEPEMETWAAGIINSLKDQGNKYHKKEKPYFADWITGRKSVH